jgi:hypothetical protein
MHDTIQTGETDVYAIIYNGVRRFELSDDELTLFNDVYRNLSQCPPFGLRALHGPNESHKEEAQLAVDDIVKVCVHERP